MCAEDGSNAYQLDDAIAAIKKAIREIESPANRLRQRKSSRFNFSEAIRN